MPQFNAISVSNYEHKIIITSESQVFSKEVLLSLLSKIKYSSFGQALSNTVGIVFRWKDKSDLIPPILHNSSTLASTARYAIGEEIFNN
ncbi:hypothetical protein ACTXT7_013303 [Hymenolepis weldensis]